MIKSVFKNMFLLLRPVVLMALSIFFDKKYLKGRHFNPGIAGYIWCVRSIWQRSILGLAPPLPFPAALTSYVSNGANIDIHPDDLNNFQTGGTYFQNFSGHITIGLGSYVAPNVGIITVNHDLQNLNDHAPAKNVVIGRACWIGMNSVILPGTVLGERVIVGAGSVVTKSFPEGNCVIAGNPARVIRKLNHSDEGYGLTVAE